MASWFLVTASGKDKPGIVAGVTKPLFELGGNLLDASMTRLGGEFVVMLVVSFASAKQLSDVEGAFSRVSTALTVSVRAISPEEATSTALAPTHVVSVHGADHPGIVHRVAEALASSHINITNLSTKRVGDAKKPFYLMFLEVSLPADVSTQQIQSQLQSTAHEIGVELTLREIDSVEL